MFLNRIFDFSNTKLIRKLNTLSPDIASSVLTAIVDTKTKKCIKTILEDDKIKINKFKIENIKGIEKYLIYPSNFESFTQICNKGKFKIDKVREKNTLVIPNRLSIKFTNNLSDNLQSLINKYPNSIYDFKYKQICQVFCNNDEDFNSIFFTNQEDNPDIQRVIFPYFRKMTLKLTPNILSVVFPSDIDTVLKAANIFSDFKFNCISKPTTTGSWLFYLENEHDYIKMLSTPIYYLGQVLLIRPYYGTPLIYTYGDRTPGKIIHIYYDAKTTITKNFPKFTGFYRSYLYDFERNKNLSFYFENIDDFNKLKFSNGLDLFNGSKYTMVIGDEISSANMVSPYLMIKLKHDSECELVLSQIKDEIANYQIDKYLHLIYLNIIPKSMDKYKNILNMKFELNGQANYFTPDIIAPRHTFLSNSIFISENLYHEKKTELDSNKDITVTEHEKGRYIEFGEKNKTENVLFYLSNLSPKIHNICRRSKPIFKFKEKLAISTMKSIIVPTSNSNLILAKIKTSFRTIRSITDPKNTYILFNSDRGCYPYLFADRFFHDCNSSFELKLSQIKFEKSVLIINNNSEIANSLSVEHNLNITPFLIAEDFTHYHVKLQSLHDLINVISFVDSFHMLDSQSVKFIPGFDVFEL